ncbi:ABC transporter protein [Mycena indigotica]|uniref:ABC transporter protein n=1 Tax=Mycena indigotica TaxID=2126181 RepID=A0A8H6SA90_9AGAR|nr:ABC transporter protein [Mycena indigotica]KAF7294642.1 ABC transporter protein [Mycena indigotica]
MAWLALLVLLVELVNAQNPSCVNGGVQNGSSCSCPTGFGGPTCAMPACGGNIFQGSTRALGTTPSGASFANISSCACESGWGGEGCNVCSAPAACQSAFTASGRAPTTNQTVANSVSGQNETLTCNSKPRVYASSQMSCRVENPTLQGIFPLKSYLNIMRTLHPELSPIPGSTSFGANGTVYAQLFYENVEQFYCSADSCVQTLNGDASNWICQNLACSCFKGSTFCGSGPTDISFAINGLKGQLSIECSNATTCAFKQQDLNNVFGSGGLGMNGCSFGECVAQRVIDTTSDGNSTDTTNGSHKELSGGVIGGLAAVGALVLIALLALCFGFVKQRSARKAKIEVAEGNRITVEWSDVSYSVLGTNGGSLFRRATNDKVVLDSVSGAVLPGQMMAVLGPSGAGKTTLVELLAGKAKSGTTSGRVSFPSGSNSTAIPRIGFVPQQDVLPPMLTVYEALLFAARLRLPENVSDVDKRTRVEGIMETLGIAALRDVRIGWGGDVGGGKARGISGGEMRRVSIGLELIASPDVLILDEPTSGLDSVSASRVASVLHSIAHDPENPIPVIASIHQPSSQLYQQFDSILLMSHGRALYCGPGGFAPSEYFAREASGIAPAYQQGYNVADYLLEVASDPPVALFKIPTANSSSDTGNDFKKGSAPTASDDATLNEKGGKPAARGQTSARPASYATTFLTQIQYLSGREWKILRRDKSLFITHFAVAAVLGVFCGGLYFQTGVSIAGFQSRVGCLFFLGALIAFSSLSALYNIVLNRPLFLRERSGAYYSPTAWLLSRVIFDVIPLRIVPTIVVATITYWMAGLAHDAAHYFKFLFILVLFTLAMTLYNFLLGTFFHNGGIAILLSALSALYQMTFAGFFVHLESIPPVLRWLQWLCPLKFTLEALAVNEVGSGLMIEDTLSGVPVNVSASLIMNLLFGFGSNNYYRDVLVLFAFIAGFAVAVIGTVWWKVRERR